jgi:hypothetical protein
MSRSRPGLEVEDAVPDDLHGILRHRRELTPEPVEVVPVEPTGAAFEAAGIDEVRRADLAHVNA